MIQGIFPTLKMNFILQMFLLNLFSTCASKSTLSPFALHHNYTQIKAQNNLAPSANSSTASLSWGFVRQTVLYAPSLK